MNCVHRRDVFDVVGYWNDRLFRFGDREFYNRVRVSPVPSAYDDHVTVLRFYAQHWDPRYRRVARSPQEDYLPRLGDPDWRAGIERALGEARGWVVRRRQAADLFAFAVRSGPKFVRFGYQKLRSTEPGRS